LFDDPRVDDGVPAPERAVHLHRARSRRGARRLLSPCRGVHVVERARGLLRAAGRSDGGRRADRRLRGGGRPRHAGRRRPPVRAEGPGICGGAFGRGRFRRRSPRAGHRRPAPTARRFQRRADRPRSRQPDPATFVKLAFIVQRYGTEVLGGSEHLCRLVAERLCVQHEVDVLTTCARDYITWNNVYPEGSDRIRGVTVRRFANAQTRDLAAFNQYSEWIYSHPHSRTDELEWLKQQGPWCPSLVEYLRRHQQQYDVLIFF